LTVRVLGLKVACLMTILFGFSGAVTMGMPTKVVMVGATSAVDEGGGTVVEAAGGLAITVAESGGIDADVVGAVVCTDTPFKFKGGFCVAGFGVVASGETHPKATILSMRLVTISRGILLFFITTSRIVFGI